MIAYAEKVSREERPDDGTLPISSSSAAYRPTRPAMEIRWL